MTRDDLERRLSALEEEFGVDDNDAVFVVLGYGAAEDGVDLAPYTVSHDLPEDDPADALEEPAIPHHKPTTLGGGVHVLSAADIEALWQALPDDVLEAEFELRVERGDPIPPILQR